MKVISRPKNTKFLPVDGIAVQLSHDNEEVNHNGMVFCSLPLPINSLLPVHVIYYLRFPGYY